MSAPQLTAAIQGQTVLTADLMNSWELTCDSAAELSGFVGLPGMQVFMRGFVTPGDGGQGPFYWASGTYTNDGVNTIVPTGATSGAWLRLYLNAVVPLSPLVTVSGTTILKTQVFIPINNTTGGPFSISMPAAPVNGETHTIKDWLGNAATYNITVQGNGSNIDAAGNFALNSDYQSINVIYAYGKWGVW